MYKISTTRGICTEFMWLQQFRQNKTIYVKTFRGNYLLQIMFLEQKRTKILLKKEFFQELSGTRLLRVGE